MNSPVDVTTGISTIPGVTTTGDTARISCDNWQDLRVTTFNCKGFKQSFTYCTAILEKCDILCLSETWLRPHKLSDINKCVQNNMNGNFDVYAKSGMLNIEADYMSRPLGGVVIICKRNSNLTYRELVIPSDRIVAVCISNKNGKPLQIIPNVYMPFFNGSSHQTELFIEMVDIMQSFLDQYATIICQNGWILQCTTSSVTLSRCQDLWNSWHRLPGLNRHSAIMYDFLVSNDLAAVDFLFKQTIKYTYFPLNPIYSHGLVMLLVMPMTWKMSRIVKILNMIQGLYSLSGETSYCKISWSLEAARFEFRLFQSLWNLTGTSAALPRCLSNFGGIRSL